MKKQFIFITDLHITTQSNVRTGDYLSDIIKKLEFTVDYANKHDATILIGGDLFDKPSVPDFVKSAVGQVFQKAHWPIYCIWGNHDQLYSTHDKDDKTSYQLLCQFGVIRNLETEDYGDFVLTSKKPLQTIGKPQLAMFHGFLNQEDKGWEVMFPDITIKDQAMVLLGHDHVPYEPLEYGSVRVIRPGSFTRVTRETASFRTPVLVHILVNTEDPNRVFKFKLVPIEAARTPEEVFKEKKETISAEEKGSYEEIVKSLMSVEQQDLTLMGAVNSVADAETAAYIKEVYDEVQNEKESK